MYEDILVPTDGSDAADGAVTRAVELADTYGARLHSLYVVPPMYALEGSFERVYTAMEDEGDDAVAAVADRARAAGLDVTTEVRRGDPARQILSYTDEHGVNMVVMGTHGRTGLDRYLVGSVTEKVVRRCPVPVLTVRHGAADLAADAGEGGDSPADAEAGDEADEADRD